MSKSKPVSPKAILVGVLAIAVFSLLLSSVLGLFSKYIAIRKHIKTLKDEKTALEEKKQKVSTMNEYIDSSEGREEVFRDKYRLVKPGEGMIVVTNDEVSTSPVATKKPVLRQFWESIVGGLGLK